MFNRALSGVGPSSEAQEGWKSSFSSAVLDDDKSVSSTVWLVDASMSACEKVQILHLNALVHTVLGDIRPYLQLI